MQPNVRNMSPTLNWFVPLEHDLAFSIVFLFFANQVIKIIKNFMNMLITPGIK